MSMKPFLAVVAMSVALGAQAATWSRQDGDSSLLTDAKNWTGGELPGPSEDVTITSSKFSSGANNSTSNYTFNVHSLTLDRTWIHWYHYGALIIPSGIILKGEANDTANFGYSLNAAMPTHVCELRADITMESGAKRTTTCRSNGQHILFSGRITGDSTTELAFNTNEWSTWNTNDFAVFTGDLSNFRGTIRAYDGAPSVWSNGFFVLSFGTTTFGGTAKLDGGNKTFIRPNSDTDVVSVAKLDMSAQSGLLLDVDVANGRCGRFLVTDTYTRGGSHVVCARFQQPFSVNHAAVKFPLLTVSKNATGDALALADYTLVPSNAGTCPPGALALSVENDGNGDPTLYLSVAESLSNDIMLGQSDGAGESAFLSEYASHWSPAGVPSAGHVYMVNSGLELKSPRMPAQNASGSSPYGAAQVFGGDELVLGDLTSQGKLGGYSWAKLQIPRLTLVNGLINSVCDWSGYRGTCIVGDVNVLATSAEKAVFKTGNTWQRDRLEGRLLGASDARLRFQFANANSYQEIASDCSGFHGLIEMYPDGNSNKAVLYLESTDFAGTVVFGAEGSGSKGTAEFYAANGATMGGLWVKIPTQLAAGINTATWASTPIVVTNSFVMNQPITIAATVTGTDPVQRTTSLEGHFVQILKVKKTAGTIDMSRVSIGSMTGLGNTPNDYFSLEVDDTDPDYYILGLRTYPMRYLKYSDDVNIPNDLKALYPSCTKTPRTSFDEAFNGSGNSDRVPGWSWNVNERPNFSYDYAVCGQSMRSSSSETQANQYFQGRRLYLKGAITHQSHSITITNLHLIGGTITHAHNGGATGVYAGTPYADITYTRSVWGNAKVNNASTFSIPDQTSTNCLRIGLNFSGSATLDLARVNGGQTIGSYCDLCGDNSAFTGIFSLKSVNSVNDTATRRTFFLFHEQKNLGGDPEVFNQKGVNLQCGVTLQPFDSATISYVNRGILVNGLGSFGVRGGEVFTIDAPVTWRGQANKFGDGVVRFAKAPKFTTAENTAGTDAVVESMNLLRVAEGSVGVHDNAYAMDGLQISFEGNGALNVRVRDDDASTAATLGVKNVKAATPFVLNAQGKLPVVFDMTGVTERKSRTVAICTVPAAKAAAIRGNFQFTPPSRYSVKETETADGDNVTFLATLGPTGCTIVFR